MKHETAIRAACAILIGLPLTLLAAVNVKTVGGVARTNVKTVGGVARANVKSVGGVDNTGGGGAPAGNAWTIVGYTSSENSVTYVGPAGAIGDILIVRLAWSGGGTLTGMTSATSPAGTLRGTQVNASNGDKSARFVSFVCADTATDSLTPAFTGTGSFRCWQIWRLRVTGTVTYGSGAIGNGTSTALATGTFTTATQNGIVLAGGGLYGSVTASSPLIGGNAATTFRNAETYDKAWDYLHTSQLSGATANLTINSSIIWIANALELSAQ